MSSAEKVPGPSSATRPARRAPATVALDLRSAGHAAAVAVDSRGQVRAWAVVTDGGDRLALARGVLRELRQPPRAVRVLLGAAPAGEPAGAQAAFLTQPAAPDAAEIAAALLAEGFAPLHEPAAAALAVAPGSWLAAACEAADIAPLAAGLAADTGAEPDFFVDQQLAAAGLSAGAALAELGPAGLLLAVRPPGAPPCVRALPEVHDAAEAARECNDSLAATGGAFTVEVCGQHAALLCRCLAAGGAGGAEEAAAPGGASGAATAETTGRGAAVEMADAAAAAEAAAEADAMVEADAAGAAEAVTAARVRIAAEADGAPPPAACDLALRLALGRGLPPPLSCPRLERRRRSLGWARRTARAGLVMAAAGLLLVVLGLRLAWTGRMDAPALRPRLAADARLVQELRQLAPLAAEVGRLRTSLAGMTPPWPPVAAPVADLARRLPPHVGWQRLEVQDGTLEIDAAATGEAPQDSLAQLRRSLERAPDLVNLSWKAPGRTPEAAPRRQVFRATLRALPAVPRQEAP